MVNSVKTGVVVVVLLGVLYGVYKVLSVPEKPLTPEEQAPIKLAENLTFEDGTEIDPGAIQLGPTVTEPVDQYPATMPNLANVPQDLGSGGRDFNTPALAAEHDLGGSGNRNDFAQTEPDLGGGRQSTASEAYTSAVNKQDAIGGNVPPLDHTAQYQDKAAESSYYGKKADQAQPSVGHSPSGVGDASRNDDDIAARAFDPAMFKAKDLIAQGNFRDALAELTKFYDAPRLSSEEQEKLINWLDPLVGKVIYSSEHQLESPRVVRSGESLGDIAWDYGIPETLLYNINRNKINNPRVLRPGTELKVVRGPFEAHVSLSKGKLTLFLGELYAGHFPITFGRDPRPQPGTYYVKQVLQGREYVAADGRSIPADSPGNPYGRWWIDLGSEMSIHGSADDGNVDGRGCISLSAVDIVDLSEILSRDSKIRIEE
jgi:hypothetical protein